VIGVSKRASPAVQTALAWLVATQAPLLVSCGKHERSERQQQTAPSTESPAKVDTSGVTADTSRAQPAESIGEPAIVDIVRTANTIAIRSARLARTHSTNDAVQAYAVQILEDHTAANAKLSAVARRLGVRATDNSTSRTLTANADHARAAFETKRGATFDRAYLENEIGFHHQMLDLLDQRMIPAVADSGLKSLLLIQRSTFEAHLDHANHAQASLAP
jgi:putative membrane protein